MIPPGAAVGSCDPSGIAAGVARPFWRGRRGRTTTPVVGLVSSHAGRRAEQNVSPISIGSTRNFNPWFKYQILLHGLMIY